MKYKHLSQAERYQIYALMQAEHDQTQIAKPLDGHKTTISRELILNAGSRSYRPKQACEFSAKRAHNSRNAPTSEPWVMERACSLVQLQWSPKQIAARSRIIHDTHVYVDKDQGRVLCKSLRFQRQKRKHYACRRDRRGQIPYRKSLSKRPLPIEARRQVGHLKSDTFIGQATNVRL